MFAVAVKTNTTPIKPIIESILPAILQGLVHASYEMRRTIAIDTIISSMGSIIIFPF